MRLAGLALHEPVPGRDHRLAIPGAARPGVGLATPAYNLTRFAWLQARTLSA